MDSCQHAARWAAVMIVATATLACAQVRKEYRYTVGPRASVSVTNQYGPISVKPAVGSQVTITVIMASDKVEIDQTQSGSRVDILSHLLDGANADNGRVDYVVMVPADASVSLHSTSGPLRAEKLHGDLTVEGTAANVEVRDITSAHVHVKTLNGPVTLTNITNGHVEITSVSGDVTMNAVNGQLVQVNSTSGTIRYDGDFGDSGEYRLSSHSGNIEATAPSTASFDVTARSVKGTVENDFTLQPKHTPFVIKTGSAFAGTMGKAASSVKLFSISGKIHLKQR